MHQISLSCIVGCRYKCTVVNILSPEHTVSAEFGILECKVQFWSYVLSSQDLDVGFLLILICKQGSGVSEFCIRSLCIEHRKCFRCEAPDLVWSKVLCVLIEVAFEEIVRLYRRTCNSQPCRVDILFHEREIMEVVVERSIRILLAQLYHVMEVLVVLPCDDPFILHVCRDCKSLEDTWCRFDYTVFSGAYTILDLHLSPCLCHKYRQFLLGIIFLALLAGERAVP